MEEIENKKVTTFKLIEAFEKIKKEIKEEKYRCEIIEKMLEKELNADFYNINDCAFKYISDIYEVVTELMETLGYQYIEEKETPYYAKIVEKKEKK